MILLPSTTLDGAINLAEKVRQKVEESSFLYEMQKVAFTVSLGVSMRENNALDIEESVILADKALYLSKERGRNRVSSF